MSWYCFVALVCYYGSIIVIMLCCELVCYCVLMCVIYGVVSGYERML